jgi:hypothetical protein
VITVVISVGVAVVAAFAVRSPGYAGSSVAAAPRSVWVTNAAQFLLGRINRQIDELDSAVVLSSGDFDVLQEGTTVLAVDWRAHQLRVVDPSTVALSRPLRLPDNAAVALGGGVVAIADRTAGKVWTLPADQVAARAGSDVTTADPAIVTGPGTVLAVSEDGEVAATAPGAQSVATLQAAPNSRAPASSAPPASQAASASSSSGASATGGTSSSVTGQPAHAEVQAVPLDRALPLGSDTDRAPISLSMVGDDPVVLDRPGNRILVGDKDFPLPEGTASATLQATGPSSGAVLVAGRSSLMRISLDDGSVQSFDPGTTGDPAAPVWLGGCAYAAWAGGTPTYLSWCGSVPQVRPLPNSDASHPLVFRVNGPEIVLNDAVGGAVWTLDASMAVVNNWSQVAPISQGNPTKQPNAGQEQQSEQNTLSRTDCSKGVTAPTAVADVAGVRAGRPTVIPVMANDATTDCSVVVVDKVSGWSAGTGDVQITQDGQGLQVTAPQGATGTLPPLQYEISDGAGHSSTATVTVSVVPGDEHPAPQRLRDSATLVGPNGTVSVNVLADWVSRSGDPLWLTAADAEGQDLAVGFQASGSVTVTDSGVSGPGKHTVTFALTDGVNVEHGVLVVDVVAQADAKPIASPVYATGSLGVPITLSPLSSVINPSAAALRLDAVTSPAAHGGVTVTSDLDAGTVTVTAAAPGSYQLGYQVAAADATATGVIRVVVTNPADDGDPVPVTDVAFLPQSGQVRIDLTANDVDASGGVLAVQRVSVPATSALVVTVADMHVAQISARRALPAEGVWFTYEVSDGGPAVTGWVHVLSVAVPEGEGPVAQPARISVRAGDAVTLPLSAVAVDLDGNAMVVEPFDALPKGQGLLFAAGDQIRYLAPDSAPSSAIKTTYSVVDTAGRTDTAPLTIDVVDGTGNHPPRTPPLAVARVFAGSTVSIALPLDGIDPDGDWVTVRGIDDPGHLGSPSVDGPDSISYTALDVPGADTVTYTAEDTFGAQVTGRIDIVVVPIPSVAEPPVAPDLKVSVAPGHSIAVDVLDAVSDPAGSAVTFAGAPTVPAGAGITADVVDGALAITASSVQEIVPVTYTVVNARGLSASGVVTVTVTPDAAPVPPTASDVWVTQEMLGADKASVVVDLTGSVTNPGGTLADLAVSLPAGPSRATVKGLTVTVPLTGSRQVVAYQVRNAEGLTADAFIVVPERATLVPQAPPTGTAAAPTTGTGPSTTSTPPPPPFNPSASKPLIVDAGTTATIVVADHVTGAAPGRTITVPSGASLSASVGTVGRVDAGTVTWTVPADASGAAVLRLQVTDGVSDPVSVAIMATVTPKQVPPPTFAGTPLNVSAGGTAAVNLADLVTPGGPGQKLSYSGPTGQGNGVSGYLSGSTLTVSAQPNAVKGSTVNLGVTVSDGVHNPVPATIAVNVLASTAPLATVPDVTVQDANQGQPVTRDVLKGSTNPLSASGPLRVLSQVAITQGKASATVSGSSITVTPGATQVGVVSLTFTVADATGDPSRYVTGTMTVVVRGKPDRVGTPSLVSVGDRTAVLKWTTPQDNGSAISGYTVSARTGWEQACSKSPCTLVGLTNNVTYRFAVVAHNQVGDSPPSPQSAQARPDVAPATPQAPSVTFGDSSVTATWKAPVDNGSPITGYLVTITPKPKVGAATVHVSGLTYSFRGLVNGTGYAVTVIAQNSSGTDSPRSDQSDTVVPAGVPGTPTAPQLTYQQAQAADSRIDVVWTAPDGNGDDQLSYRLLWTAGGGKSGSLDIPAGRNLSASITGVTVGLTYRVTVVAVNKAGSSPPSPASTLAIFAAPDPVAAPTVQATGVSGTVVVSWNEAKANGSPVTQYQYTTDGGGTWISVGMPQPFAATVTGLRNGKAYRFQVRACDGAAFDACSDASPQSAAVTPYGPIAPPTVVVSGTTVSSVTFSWSAPANNGLGPYQYEINGAGRTNKQSVSVATACGVVQTVSVVAVDTAGHLSPAGTASGRAGPCPPPPFVDEEVDTHGLTGNGAPTFPSLADLTGDGSPFLGYQSIQHVACYVDAHLIGTDAGRWYQIYDGPAAGRWTPSNNFTNARDPNVPAC